MLSTNYVLGTMPRGYDILKLIAAQKLTKAWLRESMEALGGKAVSLPNKGRSSEHGVCTLCYICLPHTHRYRMPFAELCFHLMPSTCVDVCPMRKYFK